jgi:hypothetical protein
MTNVMGRKSLKPQVSAFGCPRLALAPDWLRFQVSADGPDSFVVRGGGAEDGQTREE